MTSTRRKCGRLGQRRNGQGADARPALAADQDRARGTTPAQSTRPQRRKLAATWPPPSTNRRGEARPPGPGRRSSAPAGPRRRRGRAGRARRRGPGPLRREVLPGLAEILKCVHSGDAEDWNFAAWLVSPVDALHGKSAIQWLRDGGELEPVLTLARDIARRYDQ